MSDNIEHLFQSSQTQKNVPLSPGAWNRLDDLLDRDESQAKRSFRMRIMGIAASLVFLLCAFLAVNNGQGEDYKLEMLVIDQSELQYSASEVAQLNIEHQTHSLQKLRPFYNENGQVVARIN